MSTELGQGSEVRRTALPNGIRVVSETMPGLSSETVGVWVGSGSRSETEATAGSTHFLEHMLFKGTRRRSAKEIAQVFDRTGGDANAVTAKEYTSYYARCLVSDLAQVTDTLWDMVLGSVLDAGELERERTVIVDELAMAADDPQEVLFEAYDEVIYAGSSLGRPVGATKEQILALGRDALVDYYAQAYSGPGLVFAAAGGASHQAVVDLVQRATAGLPEFGAGLPGEVPARGGATSAQLGTGFRAGVRHIEKPTEQQGILLGVPGLREWHDDRFTLTVMSGLLGGGMSSRLFQTVREERGLAYSVHTTGSQYSDVGDFGVYAGCAPGAAQQVIDLCYAECVRLAKDGPGEAEVADTAAQISAATVLGMESTAVRMNRLARSELAGQQMLSADELVARVRDVTATDVTQLAQRLFAGPWAMCSVGPANGLTLPE